MNSSTVEHINHELDKSLNKLKEGKLPLWAIVLMVVAFIVLISSLGSYLYQQKELSSLNKTQQNALAQQQDILLKQPDVINTNWLRTLNPKVKNVQGGIVWSNAKQQGIATFINLPNSKKNQRYHLWIYDLSMSAGKRISAAVFNKKSVRGSEYMVAIKPSTPVKLPFKFELVLEQKIDADSSAKSTKPAKSANAAAADQTTTKPADSAYKESPLLLAQP